MGRTELVNARTEALKSLSDKELVTTILAYFEDNKTMPGEKNIKDRAALLLQDVESGQEFMSEIREELIEEFASLVVKETKIAGNLILDENKKNRDAEGTKASDLPMVLKDSVQIPTNAMKNVYEMSAYIGQDGSVFSEGGEQMGTIPAGFLKNHPSVCGMHATVIASDYSNGKFANMSYRLIVDLGQNQKQHMVNAA